MTEHLLYHNDFIPGPSVRDDAEVNQNIQKRESERQQFRSYYENRHGLPAFRSKELEAGSSARGQIAGTSRENVNTLSPEADLDVNVHTNRPKEYFEYNAYQTNDPTSSTRSGGSAKTRTKIICIDSRDRDSNLYPSPSNFRVYLPEKFTNVRRMRLVSTELPNTEQLIKSQPLSKKNNKLYWQNSPDEKDADEIYSITITDGNYTPTSFSNEIITKTAQVERKITTATDEKIYSDFQVIVDNITNRFIIRQNNSFNLDNPISTVAGSSVVSVSQDDHGFLPGQIINISGSTKVGGIPVTTINSSQVIDVDIEKVDKLYRVSSSTEKNTYVIYGTTRTELSGMVITKLNEQNIHGLGTKFLTETSVGQVINVGYHNYTIQSVVDDVTLGVEEILQETFDENCLIMNLLTPTSPAFTPISTDSTKTQVSVINHRLRNINDPTQSAADQAYEDEILDLSFMNYEKMQSQLTIYDQTRSYELQVNFDSREPTYTSFSSFTIRANIENFNLQTITAVSNFFNVVLSNGNQITTIAIPPTIYSTISFLVYLQTVLPNYEISFDNVNLCYYIKPPLSSTTTNITLTTVGISDDYFPINLYGLDFTNSNPDIQTILGFQPGLSQIFGNAIVGSFTVNPTSAVSFDPSLNSFYIISAANVLLYTITVNRTTFSNITDLVSLIKSTLLSRNVPMDIVYNTGLNKTVITSLLTNLRFSIIFKQPTSPLLGIGDALGFNVECLNTNATIVSQLPIKNYVTGGYYTFPLADYINAVPISSSRKIRGTAIVTNTLNTVSGGYDIFVYDENSFSNMMSVSGSTDSVTGNISGRHGKFLSSIPNVSTLSNQMYFSPVSVSVTYDPSAFTAQSKVVTLYLVNLNSAGHYNYIKNPASQNEIIDETTNLEIYAGETTVFDLHQLISTSSAVKFSTTQNGTWKNGQEFIAYRKYLCGGRYLQFTPPLSMANSLLFIYDEFNQSTVTSDSPTTVTPSTACYYYVNLIDGYLNLGTLSSITNVIEYSVAPIIDLYIGSQYVLDYSPLIQSNTSSSDVLKLSMTVDGTHFFGSELTDVNYMTFGTNKINIDLDYGLYPFPDKLFYYMRDAKGTGGAGYLAIKFRYNSGAIAIKKPAKNHYDFFISGRIINVLTDPNLTDPGFVSLYSPFNNLTKYSAGSRIAVLDTVSQTSVQSAVLVDGYTVTFDNNRFILRDTTQNASYTITLSVGYRSGADVAIELLTLINTALGLTSSSNGWNIVFDATTNLFTFLISNSRSYQFIFTGTDTNGNDLLNSASEIIGFSQSETPSNVINYASNTSIFTSSVAADFTIIQSHIIKLSSSDLSPLGTLNNQRLRWSETAVHDADSSKIAVFSSSASMLSGTRFTSDLKENDSVLLGEDYDTVFIVTNIIDDYTFQINTNVNFIAATQAADGTIIAPPAVVYYQNIYVLTSVATDEFLQNEKINFFRNRLSKSIYDYDGRLVDKDLQVTRVSPIKLSFVDTDILLEDSLTDQNNYNYLSLFNHDLYYIKNNSKYHFNIPLPATATISGRGGNPVKIGTGVKFRLLFSNTDTPGDLLGFPDVGNILLGDTEFKTVQSNTVMNTSSNFNIIRSEVGLADQAGNLKIVTATPHNFEFGDTVYIEKHQNSSNDLAVNNDEGNIITISANPPTFVESDNGVYVTRGFFYIPLNLTSGGIGGVAYKKQLYKPFALAGENYLYLVSPILSCLTTTSNLVTDVFAKVLLNAPPGSILFNSFVTSDKYFDEAPLAVLEYLDLAIVDLHGEYFEFNNIDWSASFSVTYSVSTPEHTGISSRTLERNDL